jgi:3'-phosphoadenosine 5'-phosphosulfate sulfotransferase (PAPS reductase)/FAD synthetase
VNRRDLDERKKILDRLDGRRVVASVSGGKDSAAMALRLKELEIDHDQLFADTGWEADVTYDYLRGPLARAIGPVEEVKSEIGGMEDLIRKKGSFPSRLSRFCTEELKVKPVAKRLNVLQDSGVDTVNAVGVRAEESEKRAAMPEWEWSKAYDCEVWRPMLGWKLGDVLEIHRRHGLSINPLYFRTGVERVGCWPCVQCRKAEIRAVAESDPGRIEQLRRLEAEVTERRGATRAFFQAKTGRTGEPWPIDRVVAWSKTPTRGRHVELFDDGSPGCVRWGMCEFLPSLKAEDEAA